MITDQRLKGKIIIIIIISCNQTLGMQLSTF